MALSVLVVDSDKHRADGLAIEARKHRGEVTTRHTYEDAQKEIQLRAPLILIAHARIRMSQGVHLAQLAVRANGLAHALIYGSPAELVLAHDMFSTRAFFVRESLVSYALPRFLISALPVHERRDVRVVDRRTTFRGGRRASDVDVLWHESSARA